MRNKRIRALFPAVLCLLLFALLFAGCGEEKGSAPDAGGNLSAGLSYVRALEEKDPDNVDDILKDRRRQELLAMRDEKLRQLQSGEISVWPMFQDYVIIGDSRAAGFTFLGTLDDSRNFAAYGNTISSIPDVLDAVHALNPSYIFVVFGLNDMLQAGCETPEAFAEQYRQALMDLQAEFPDAKIYVNSIFPCTDPAFEKWEKWREAEAYSEAVAEMVPTTSCYYISNDNITDFSPYFKDDGIHFTNDFYDIWAVNMIMAVYDSESEAVE